MFSAEIEDGTCIVQVGIIYMQTQRTYSMMFFWMKKGFRLTKRCLVYGWAIKSASVKIKEINQCSAFRERARNAMNKRRRHPSTQQKRKINTSADLNYFYTEKINNVHEFSFTRNAVYFHVTCTVVTVHAIWKPDSIDGLQCLQISAHARATLTSVVFGGKKMQSGRRKIYFLQTALRKI